MTKYISIDPGRCKCGLIFADFDSKKILNAFVIESHLLVKNIKNISEKHEKIKVIIGNGTTSQEHIKSLSFLGKDLTVVGEKFTTLRAKERYFEIYPIKGWQRFLPRDVFLFNINLDAISALIILEDYLNIKFTLSFDTKFRTLMK
tara:strand:- start:593 stop:1030 length:438 start_codon:yes stop_codon:yes gene_type:complete